MRWLLFLLLVGCGGATADVDGGASDASLEGGSPKDANGADAPKCPPGTPPIPDAAVYACDAGARPDAGCHAAGGDPNHSRDPNIYPLGCTVTLPTAAPYCGDGCCGPQTCNCQSAPIGSGAEFLCPL